MTHLDPELLDLLAEPVTLEALRPCEGDLVTVGEPASRYRVHDGIPVLLPRLGGSSGQVAGIGANAVIASFRERAHTYYADNYVQDRNPERAKRKDLAERLLSEFAEPRMRVLDVGAGPAILAGALQRLKCVYVALDLSLENLVAGRRRVGDLVGVVGTATALPVRDRSFDGVVSMGSMEYIEDLPGAIAEASRVLRPGGFVMFSFANRSSPRRRWDESVVNRIWRMKRRWSAGAEALYDRYLTDSAEVERLFRAEGLQTVRRDYLNAGLLGYPLSNLPTVRRLEVAAARRYPAVERLSAEFIVTATKAADRRRANF